MRSKTNKLFTSSSLHEYDIIVIVETWLKSDIISSELFDSSYFVYRKDRSPSLGWERGGGVLIAVRTTFNSKLCSLQNDSDDIEQLCVCVSSKCLASVQDIFFIVSYIRPSSGLDIYSSHISNINYLVSGLTTNQTPCIFGDFNIGDIDWCYMEEEKILIPFNVTKDDESLVVDSLSSLDLFQINNVRNNLGRILDLTFINNDLKYYIQPADFPLLNNSFHHKALQLHLGYYNFSARNPNLKCKTYNYANANFIGLNDYFTAINWNDVFEGKSLESMYTIFKQILATGTDLFVPYYTRRLNFKLPWHNKRLINLKNVKDKAFKRSRLTGNSDDRAKFLQLRKEHEFLNKFLYRQYITSIESNIKRNSKSFWCYLNSKRKGSALPQCMELGDEQSNDIQSSCQLFAKFFQSSYNSDTIQNVESMYCDINSSVDFSPMQFSVNEVLDCLNGIDPSKKAGYDLISPFLLSKCAVSLSSALVLLFNKSLSSGEFISDWKVSFINPIYKSGPKHKITNYRPISKLSIVPKVLEKIVTQRLYFYLQDILSSDQHGFIKGRSTCTNLVLFSKFCIDQMEKGYQVDVLYTDFVKAFDRVHHELLLQKLSKLGFNKPFLNWLRSYLSNRKQVVQIGCHYSDFIDVISGLPQGSHLGPLLFNVFINDLPKVLKHSRCLMYADDVKIFHSVGSTRDCFKLQLDINCFLTWCTYNHLKLNFSKCKVFSATRLRYGIVYDYKFYNDCLVRVQEVKDLGVLFDTKLDFRTHIDYIVSKGNSLLGFLYRCVYFEVLEYCSVVWSPFYANSILRIERIQKRFTRFALRRFNWSDDLPTYLSRCSLMDMKTLRCRREAQCVLFVRDVMSHHIDSTDLLSFISFYVPERIMRHRNELFYIPPHRTNYGLNEPLTRSLTLFNAFCDEVDICMNRVIFKRMALTVIARS